MSALDFVLLVGAVVSAAIYFIHRKYSYWSDKNVEYIKPIFPYGILRGAGKQLSTYEIIQEVYKKMKPTGLRYVGVYFFIQPVALILDLDFIKTVLIKDFNYFHDRGFYHNEKDDPLSAHLLAIEGQKWKNLRNKVTPTFSSGKMKMMFPTMVKIGEELKTTVAKMACDSESIEMRDLLARFTTDIIGTCAFGLECNSLKDPDAEFRRFGRKIFNTPRNPVRRLFTLQFRDWARKLRLKVVPKEVTSFFMRAVRDTIAFREENNIVRNDFMNLMIEMKNSEDPSSRLTVNEIAAQAFIFFLAGFETSSTAMSFALYELALNPNIQNKARECVLNSLKKHRGELTYDAVMEMGYINQCINESLRKYPPATGLIRCATADYNIPDSKVVIETGTTVLIPVYAIHHDPEFYPDPEVYDPDRFTPENEIKRNPMSFMPFGEGPRNCIGLRFGLMQSRIGLAVLLRSFRFDIARPTATPLVLSKTSAVLAPVGGVWLKVEKLD